MNEYMLSKLLENPKLVKSQLIELEKQITTCTSLNYDEIKGHMSKAEHNLQFVEQNIPLGFLDWAITGCYYACYHAALSILQLKGYSSKNHYATILLLIREYYRNELSTEDFKIYSDFFDYYDLLFYVESKTQREDASYSVSIKFNRESVEKMRLKALLFVSKCKQIIANSINHV